MSISLKSLPPDARPREKLLSRGAAALSDAELLAILLRTGTQGKDVMQLCRELLALPQAQADNHNARVVHGVAGLLYATPQSLRSIQGLGPAKRCIILAVMELAHRALAQQLTERTVLGEPASVRQYVQLHLANRAHEVFAVLFLDSQFRLLAMEELFRGTISQTNVYPREVVVRALQHQATAVVLAHNHPSGSVTPSMADQTLTQTLVNALALVDVRVLDHIIVGPGQACSMAEHGLL